MSKDKQPLLSIDIDIGADLKWRWTIIDHNDKHHWRKAGEEGYDSIIEAAVDAELALRRLEPKQWHFKRVIDSSPEVGKRSGAEGGAPS